jgi:hypothetical protein
MANKKITDLMSGTPVRDSLLESVIDINGTLESRKVKAGAVADLASANVAAPYDSTVTYAIGQYCLYEGDIYRCIAITTGAFDSTAWTQIVVTGEFRRVVELTSAQYSALSSAEKNNGTLYVITDEETTAADIPYSSGVSVADKIDEANGQIIPYSTWSSMTPQEQADAGKVFVPDYPALTPNATEIAMSPNDSTSVADKLATIPTFTAHADIITFSSVKTGYKDVAFPIGKIIPQGALLSADVGVPLVFSLQDLGNNTTRLRATSSTGTAYTSNVSLLYLTID